MSQYKMTARDRLAGHWGSAILVCLVAALLTTGSNSILGQLNLDEENIRRFMHTVPHIGYLLFSAMSFAAVVSSALALVRLVIGGVIELGSARFHLNLMDRREAQFTDLLSQFSRFADALVMNLLRSLFIALWCLLLVIPGVVAAFSYAMAPYILLEDPACTGSAALRRSKIMMQGHKMDLFLLELSFIGWHILCVLSFGIGYLWLNPYIEASKAAFYREISATAARDDSRRYSTTVEF